MEEELKIPDMYWEQEPEALLKALDRSEEGLSAEEAQPGFGHLRSQYLLS
jgi:hypothetical protein